MVSRKNIFIFSSYFTPTHQRGENPALRLDVPRYTEQDISKKRGSRIHTYITANQSRLCSSTLFEILVQ